MHGTLKYYSPVRGVLFLIVFTLITACQDQHSSEASAPSRTDQRSAVPVPAELGRALNNLPGATLELALFRNQEDKPYQTISVTVNPSGNRVEPFKVTLPLGSQTLWINEIVVDLKYGRVEIARTQPQSFNVIAGEPLDFSGVQFQAPPDDDGDGVPNLFELLAGTDPGKPDDKPVVSEARQLEQLTIDGINLQPFFEPRHPSYSGRLPADVTEIVITAKPKRSSASLSINGVLVDVGQPHKVVMPPRGAGKIDIVVEALGETATYVVYLTRDDIYLSASPRFRSVELVWKGAAQSYTVYRSSEPCDVVSNSRCTDDAVYVDAKSPFPVTGLDNGTRYYFRMVAQYPDRSTILTNTVVAIPRAEVLDCCVQTIGVAEDGTAYIGGAFKRASSLATHGMVVDNTIGAPDNRFPPIHGTVMAAAPDGAGGWYVGGQFTRVENLARYNLVHVLSNGEVDPNWRPEVRMGSGQENRAQINAILVVGTNVIVGGIFDEVSGFKRGNFAAIAETGEVVSWDEIGIDGEVRSLTTSRETVFVGGRFTRIGNQLRQSLAAVSVSDGSLLSWNADRAFKQPQTVTVNTLAVADGVLYVGGVFDLVADGRRSLFALSVTDATLQSWAPRIQAPNYNNGPGIFSLAVSGGIVYIAGSFESINDIPWSHVAALAVDDGGSLLTSWKPGGVEQYTRRASIRSLSVSDDVVYLGGEFIADAYSAASPIGIAVGPDGKRLPWLSATESSPGPINVVIAAESQVFIGGDLGFYHSQLRQHLAAFTSEGELLPWNPGVSLSSGFPSEVDVIGVSGDTVYVGGRFDIAAGAPVKNFAALFRDSGAVQWSPMFESGPVTTLAVINTRLYVGGRFTGVEGVSRHGLAAFDDRRLLVDWGTRLFSDAGGGYVTALHAWDSSVLVAATDSRGVPDFFVADQAGNRGGWVPVVERKSVSSFATSSDTVFVSGWLNQSQTGPSVAVQAFSKADASKLPWATNPMDLNVKLFYRNEVLYFAGDFSSVSDEARHHLAAAHVPGGAVLDWQPNPNAPVKAITGYRDKVYVGGDFDSIDGNTTGSFAILPAYTRKTP